MILPVAPIVRTAGKMIFAAAPIFRTVVTIGQRLYEWPCTTVPNILAMGKIVLAVGKIILAVGKIILAIGRMVLPVAKMIYTVAAMPRPVGKTLLPVGENTRATRKLIFEMP